MEQLGLGFHLRVPRDHLLVPCHQAPPAPPTTPAGMCQGGQRPRGAGTSNILWPGRRRKMCQETSVKANVGGRQGCSCNSLHLPAAFQGGLGPAGQAHPDGVGSWPPAPAHSPWARREGQNRKAAGRQVPQQSHLASQGGSLFIPGVAERVNFRCEPQGKGPFPSFHQLLQPKPKHSLGFQCQDVRLA